MKSLPALFFVLLILSSNKVMQKSMQGVVQENIFKNNSYQCKVSNKNKEFKMSLIFGQSEFKFTHYNLREKTESLWFGNYKLISAGKVLFKTTEFRLKDDYGSQTKRDGEILFKVKGNSALFILQSNLLKASCKRTPH